MVIMMRNVMCKKSTKPVQLGRDLYMKRMIYFYWNI